MADSAGQTEGSRSVADPLYAEAIALTEGLQKSRWLLQTW